VIQANGKTKKSRSFDDQLWKKRKPELRDHLTGNAFYVGQSKILYNAHLRNS